MPFDGIVLKAVTEELQSELLHGRISKISQPTETEVILTIRNNRKNYQLLISIHPSYARIHLTDHKFINPFQPPNFCISLRKHIQNAIIEKIEQKELERILSIKLRAYNELGDQTYKTLLVELMGRHSNLFLIHEDNQVIIDRLKHVPTSQNRYRMILPGVEYKSPPPQNKENPLTVTKKDFFQRIQEEDGKIHQQIVKNYMGISPMLAKGIVPRKYRDSLESIWEAFKEFQRTMQNKIYQPTIYKNKREDYHVIPLHHLEKEKCFSTVSKMLDVFYDNKAERDRIHQQSKDLQRLIKNEMDKNIRKLAIHEKTLKQADQAEKYKRWGELLTAYMHQVQRGDSSITVIDYYEPDQKEVTIPLQKNLTPSENAQKLFKRYKKLLHAKNIVQKESKKAKEEIKYLEQVLQQIEEAREIDLEGIREELREEGYLKKQKKTRKRKQTMPSPLHFRSSDGIDIYVGKNNKQNEYVTQKIAHRNDIWLHTKDIPGSHVVVKSSDPSGETLLEAAHLAAYYSQAKNSSSVPVDYTKVKHVQKPKGAKPGFVIYDQQKTLFVTPDPAIIRKLEV